MKKRSGKEFIDLDESADGEPSIRAQILAQRKRTGIGPEALMRSATDVPPGLSSGTILNWLHSKANKGFCVKTARKTHIEYVLAKWQALPDRSGEERVPISDAIRQALIEHRRRTKLSPAVLLRGRTDIPNGLTSGTIVKWLRGLLKRGAPEHVEYVLRLWSDAPSVVPVTNELRRRLRDLRAQSGGSVQALIRAADVPNGLTSAMVQDWLSGGRSWARPDHIAFVLAYWTNLTPKAGGDMQITLELRALIRNHIQRTGTKPRSLLKDASDIPNGLTPAIINNWSRGKATMAWRSHWTWTIARYEALPGVRPPLSRQVKSKAYPRYCPIAEEDRAALRFHRERTGLGGGRLLGGATDKPPELQPGMISSWLTGVTDRADPAHVRYVLERYNAVPDKPVKPQR